MYKSLNMDKRIYLSPPHIGEHEQQFVAEAFATNWIAPLGPHVDAFTRLMNAGAARIVNDTASLGRAISQIIAPDHAAQMAMAGWDVVTRGADSLDRIISLVQSRLDARRPEAS